MIRIGIVGTGGMANAHANAFKKIKGVKLVAACDVDEKRVRDFAERHGIQKTYLDYRELLADPTVDAVTNVTPDAMHCAVAVATCAAGKHILSEKPIATSMPEARKMIAAAKKAGVINMVNFSYRNSSALHAAAEVVRSGKIGRVMHVESSYLQCWLGHAVWGDWRKNPGLAWRLSTKHGSLGTLGDIGCHIFDMTSYLAGEIQALQATLRTFKKGVPGEKLGEYVLDANDSFFATLDFTAGGLGTLHSTRWATGYNNSLRCRVFGDKGAVEIDLDRSYDVYRACLGKDADKSVWKDVKAKATPNMYQRFVTSIKTGQNDASDFQNGARIQAYLQAALDSDAAGQRWVKIKV